MDDDELASSFAIKKERERDKRNEEITANKMICCIKQNSRAQDPPGRIKSLERRSLPSRENKGALAARCADPEITLVPLPTALESALS
jgi:hypothetical protein